MRKRSCFLLATLVCLIQILADVTEASEPGKETARESLPIMKKVTKSDEEWKKILTPEQFHVLRKKGTEQPFTGQYHDSKEKGTYVCVACGNELFSSDTKFDSGTGWPSFGAPLSKEAVETEQDRALWMVRTEVHCSVCGGHLGHVFDDGPPPTGLRYCINSVALRLAKKG